MKKFISIVWGYPQHLNTFVQEENYHLHILEIAKESGYKVSMLIDQEEAIIISSPYFDNIIEIDQYKNIFHYMQFLWQNRAEVMYVNSYDMRSFLVPFFCRKAIFMGHSRVVRKNLIKQIIQRIVFSLFWRIRLNNEEEKQYLIQKQHILEKKLFVIPLVVSNENFNFVENKRKNIVYFGNVTENKNLKTIIKAFKIVLDSYPELQLDIIGKKWDNCVQDYVNNEKLNKKVNMLGFIPQKQVASVLNTYLINVNSSFVEGQCLSVYEAGLCGCALCLPNIMSFTGVFSDKALFHEPDDYNKLAKNILLYLNDTQMAEEHNKLCRKMIEKNYSKKCIEDKLKKLII